MTEFGCLAPLLSAHRSQLTGVMAIEDSHSNWTLTLKNGGVAGASGLPALRESFPLPETGWQSDLMADLGMVVATGIPFPEVLAAATAGVGRRLALTARSYRVRLAFTESPVEGQVFSLPDNLPKILTGGFEAAGGSADYFRRRLRHRVVLGEESAAGLAIGPIPQRLARLATGGFELGELIARAVGTSGREEHIWASAELLLALGLLDLRRPTESLSEETTEEKLAITEVLKELAQYEAMLATQSPDEILELGSVGGALESHHVVEAFRNVGARFHPDRYNRASPAVQQAAARVFHQISDAFEKVRTDEGLAAVRAKLRIHASTEDEVDPITEAKAKVHFRKAEGAARGRNWSLAIEHVGRALALDARPVRYHSHRLLWEVYSKDTEVQAALTALGRLESVTRRDQLEIHVIGGRLLKSAGRSDESIKAFKAVLELDAEHREARREVWLHKRRNSSDSDEPSSVSRITSLFSRGDR